MRPLQLVAFSQPGNASYTSAPIDLRQIVAFSLQALTTLGSLAGSIQIQISNTPCLQKFLDYSEMNPTWTNLGSPLTFTQGVAPSSQLITKQDSSYVAMRIVFTDSSSGANTASIQANVAGLSL
jgi:hypothetical protein